jgi:hypothetical protein
VVDAHSAVIGARPTAPILDPTGWRINESFADGTLTSGALGVALNPSIEDGCRPPQAAVEKCRVAIADVEAVFRAHSVLERGLTVFHAEVIPNLADLFKKRTEMWDIYRTEARPQYPWEWIVNGMVDTTLDDRKKDAHKNPIGPANLPSGQIILLHPGVGLERFDIRGTDQSASNPTLYLEWFGYNKLQWDYDAGTLRGGLGVSFVSVYSQRQDASDWSRGIMFWVSNKYGVAVTRNDSGTSIMVSVDVGELYRGKMNELNEWLRPSAEAK